MVGVKKFAVDKSQLKEKVAELLQTYHNVSMFGEGTEEHRKAGLAADKVLVKAWNKKPKSEGG